MRTTKTIRSAIDRKNRGCLCPLCGESVGRSNMGICSHLNKHVRAGQLKQEEALPLRMSLLGLQDNRTK
jgi:hypothetical protein